MIEYKLTSRSNKVRPLTIYNRSELLRALISLYMLSGCYSECIADAVAVELARALEKGRTTAEYVNELCDVKIVVSIV